MHTVLIVEDDDAIRELLSALLERAGYAVATAPNGQEAIDYLRSSPVLPSIIFLDLMMPVMNGWQFRFEQLRDPRFAKIPTVVLSALGDGANADRSLDADGYLRKPFEPRAFDRVVHGLSGA